MQHRGDDAVTAAPHSPQQPEETPVIRTADWEPVSVEARQQLFAEGISILQGLTWDAALERAKRMLPGPSAEEHHLRHQVEELLQALQEIQSFLEKEYDEVELPKAWKALHQRVSTAVQAQQNPDLPESIVPV